MIVIIGNLIYIERNENMITLFRMIRLWQLRTKWSLAFWKFVDKQVMELSKNPEELKNKFAEFLVELIHESNINN